MTLPLREVQRHTFAEYLTWPDDQRYELIDGVASAMAPAPTHRHQRLVLEVARQIADALVGGTCEVNVAPSTCACPTRMRPTKASPRWYSRLTPGPPMLSRCPHRR
jgi:hypothetical protein